MKNKVYKFPRLCSITGEGMWEGYCFGDGQDYAINKAGAVYLAMRYGYQSIEEAWEDDAYYFTMWEELDDDGWYESPHEDGRDAVWVSADGVLPSITIEFGSVVYEFNPSERDEWQSDSVYDYHYDLDNNEVCVYRVVDGDTDTSNTIHKQQITL